MRQFVPSDYVDKEGNVYETVGENIREGKNNLIASGFPSPEEVGADGLIGSDGKQYVSKLNNLADLSKLIDSAYVLRYNPKNKTIIYELPNSMLKPETAFSTPPTSKAVINYVKKNTIVPDNFNTYNLSFTYDGSNLNVDSNSTLPNAEVKFISDHFVIKSSLNISFVEITNFNPVVKESSVLDIKLYYDGVKLSGIINTNKAGTYSFLLIAG